MTEEQRATVRAVISKATVGRYNHGMELPRAWRTWNWPQFSQNIVNAALAIEGEEGETWLITLDMDKTMSDAALPKELQGLGLQVRNNIYSIISARTARDP